MPVRLLKLLSLVAVLCVVFALAANRLLDRPLAFAIGQAANHYAHSGAGLASGFASWLIGIGIAEDWSKQPEGKLTITYPLLLDAANPGNTYPYQTYDNQGRPHGLLPGPFRPPLGTRQLVVNSSGAIESAIGEASPGDVIVIAPGTYHFTGQSLPLKAAGNGQRPIYLRAERLGKVVLKFDLVEGFHIMAPFWVFENLRIEGNCQRDDRCEHAFHVVGNGHSFTLRNSELVNFNAPVKVNLQTLRDTDHFPDHGLIEYNSFFNERSRNTGNPVTLLNINSADGWVVRGNYLADFAKARGNRISYGAFMKGNGTGGLFERNLVMCEHRLPPDAGARIGLSFGGGGTQPHYCRHGDCRTEYAQGVMRNNIILNCSRDVGIYLNRARASGIHHNLLYNTLGIDVRFEPSLAEITNNIVSGRIKDRDGGQSRRESNLVFRDCLGQARHTCPLTRLYASPDKADVRLQAVDNPLSQPLLYQATVNDDFCGNPVPGSPDIGPIQYKNGLDCLVTGVASPDG